jgi:hypothetical protein
MFQKGQSGNPAGPAKGTSYAFPGSALDKQATQKLETAAPVPRP